MNKYKEYVFDKLDDRTILEQLAEEAGELAQASMKLIRAKELNNNVTPVDGREAVLNLAEEVNDVMTVASLIVEHLMLDNTNDYWKWKRWAERLGYKDGAR